MKPSPRKPSAGASRMPPGKRDARRRRSSVGLFVETSTIYGRGVIDGVSAYLHTQGSWSIFLEIGSVMLLNWDWLLTWKGDGAICRLDHPEFFAIARRRGLPVVNLSESLRIPEVPFIGSDQRAIGRMAAEHLMDRGFRNIAFCGFNGMRWSDGRWEGVDEAVRKRGKSCSKWETEYHHRRKFGWQDQRARLAEWVSSLPRPVGIVACNDLMGYQILDSIRELDVIVPEEVAVVGVDDEPTCCSISEPPLSSVRPNTRRVGYEAAMLLDRLMNGETPPTEPILIPPLEVVIRQSTDVIAVPDRLVARALNLIREHTCDGWSVDTVVSELGTQRGMLERRFRKFIGISPHEQMRRIRIARVKQLLLETDWTLDRIGEATGYERPEYLTVQFTKIVGERPSKWRSKNRREKT